MSTGLTNMHMARVFSVLCHLFTQKQCILCSALCHKSYLTLPYVTLLQDPFCLGTFMHSLRLPVGNTCNIIFVNDCILQ